VPKRLAISSAISSLKASIYFSSYSKIMPKRKQLILLEYEKFRGGISAKIVYVKK
jgi:hypothetical protein